jgi:hypothetical protein
VKAAGILSALANEGILAAAAAIMCRDSITDYISDNQAENLESVRKWALREAPTAGLWGVFDMLMACVHSRRHVRLTQPSVCCNGDIAKKTCCREYLAHDDSHDVHIYTK